MRALLLSIALLCTASTHAHPASADSTAGQTEYSVLLVGNSLTYTNNLPALLRAVGAANGVSITTTTFAAPGGVLSERLSEGHVANALRSRHYDALLLQEQGGHLAACMASASAQRTAPCAASKRAYATFADLARTSGTKTLLMATWGPDERWDARVARSVGMLAKDSGSTVFHASPATYTAGNQGASRWHSPQHPGLTDTGTGPVPGSHRPHAPGEGVAGLGRATASQCCRFACIAHGNPNRPGR